MDPEAYTVQEELQCGLLLATTGKPCKSPKMLGEERCRMHKDKSPAKPYAATPRVVRKQLWELEEKDLKSIEDVRAFLSEVMFVFIKGGCDEKTARAISSMSTQLIAAIKERDANSPEAQARKLEQIHEIVKAAKALNPQQAREVLLSRDFRALEIEAFKVEVLEDGSKCEEDQHESAGGSAGGEEEGEADTDIAEAE